MGNTIAPPQSMAQNQEVPLYFRLLTGGLFTLGIMAGLQLGQLLSGSQGSTASRLLGMVVATISLVLVLASYYHYARSKRGPTPGQRP